jgi:hypothetical protein
MPLLILSVGGMSLNSCGSWTHSRRTTPQLSLTQLSRGSRVSQIFLNQKDLEQEARSLSLQTARYSKQTAQWLALVDQFGSALKVPELFNDIPWGVEPWYP